MLDRNHPTRRAARRLALLSHLTGAAIIAAVTFGTVVAAGSAFGQTRLPPSAAAARLAISEVCGVAPSPSFTALALSFANDADRRRMTEESKARLNRSPERSTICAQAKNRGFRN